MACYVPSTDLQTALQEHRVIIYKPKSAVLFRRGEKAFAMFVILSGKVSLDFGVDSALARSYGPGALVGSPATLTGRNYTMTATVLENAELVVWTREALDSLLQNRPDLRQQMLAVLGERMAENQKLAKAMLTRDEQPHQEINAG
jgi:CRP-like cAMP-binding protein